MLKYFQIVSVPYFEFIDVEKYLKKKKKQQKTTTKKKFEEKTNDCHFIRQMIVIA